MMIAPVTFLDFLRCSLRRHNVARVFGPFSTRSGAASPSAVTLNTSTESPWSLATYSSPRSESTNRPAGQFSCVFSPVITRMGAVSPLAFLS